MPKTLARLFPKACRAEARATKAIQEEISCWYYYGKAYEERVEEIKNARRVVSDQSARNQVYDDTMEHLPGGFTKDTLRKKTQRVVKILSCSGKLEWIRLNGLYHIVQMPFRSSLPHKLDFGHVTYTLDCVSDSLAFICIYNFASIIIKYFIKFRI